MYPNSQAAVLFPAGPSPGPGIGAAVALASMAVSFRVTQYAHQTGSAYTSIPPKAVHAVIPKSVFPAGLRDRVARWLRLRSAPRR